MSSPWGRRRSAQAATSGFTPGSLDLPWLGPRRVTRFAGCNAPGPRVTAFQRGAIPHVLARSLPTDMLTPCCLAR